MTPPPDHLTQSCRWGLLGLFLVALMLRFWHLGQLNSLVFDEVYYVRFAVDYLQQTPFVDAHPPLGKYLIALGIALFNPLAERLGLDGNTLTGVWLSPLSYRWVTALAGAGLPPLTALLAYYLSVGYPLQQRLTFGLLAGGLMLMEGLTLVESRFGLINPYWIGFGVLGQVCLLGAQSAPPNQRRYWQGGAGLALGCAIAVKWNGAGFLLGIYLLWGLSRWQQHLPRKPLLPQRSPPKPSGTAWGVSRGAYRREPTVVPAAIAQLTLAQLLFYCGLVPLAVYGVIWLPHLKLVETSWVAIHELLWQIHRDIGEQAPAHPYCSAWYTWPLLLRPVAYFYRAVGSVPPFDIADAQTAVVYTVQGLGNPILWWLSTAAIAALLGQVCTRWPRPQSALNPPAKPAPHPPSSVSLFLLVNYGANWLPWVLVQRCTFLYLYMGALVFSVSALAWLLTGWLTDTRSKSYRPALLLLLLIFLSFLFWLPLYVGLPLSPTSLSWRWWIPSWI